MAESFHSPIAIGISFTLIHFLWQGTLIAVGYWLMTTVIDFKSAQTRYAASLCALVAMAICPLITFPLVHSSDKNVLQHNAQSHPDAELLLDGISANGRLPSSADDSSVIQQSRFADRSSVNTPKAFTLTPPASFTEQRLTQIQPYILMLWLAGVLLSGARLMSSLVGIVWLKSGRSAVPEDLLVYSQQIAASLQLKSARVFISTRVRVAAAVGFFQPVVLLPASWLTALPPELLRAVVAHELAHIRRFDTWVNLMQRVLETLLFYHPGVWWLSNRIRCEREFCCDELAISATGDRRNYVIALEQVGRLEAHGRLSLMTAITGAEKMNLLGRIQHVLGVHRPQREPSWFVGLAAVASVLSLALAFGAFTNDASVFAQEGDKGRAPESDAPARRSPEADEGARRSPEADAAPRRSPEREGRRAPESDAAPRRPAERDRDISREREPQERRQAESPLRGFKPETDREAALLRMIEQLRREVAALRLEVHSRDRDVRRDGDLFRERDVRRDPEIRRDGDRPRDGDFRRDGERMPRDSDLFRERDERRDPEIHRDGDRPRNGDFRRDGERPPRDGDLFRERDERRDPEIRRDGDRPRDGDFRRDGERPPRDGDLFRERDERRDPEIRRDGDRPRDGDFRRDGERPPRDGDRPRDAADAGSVQQFRLEDNWQRSKEGGVFRAYDKNDDQVISLEEWLAMTNGNISDARRAISTRHFRDAEPSGDNKFTPLEFIWWRRIGSRQAATRARENRIRESRERDGDSERRAPRDGDRDPERGPRDGDRENDRDRGPRDGDREEGRRGPRDGEGRGDEARDTERPARPDSDRDRPAPRPRDDKKSEEKDRD